MAQLLAIEWDAREARLAVARVRGKEAVVEHAFALPLGSREDGPPSESSIGERIKQELRQRGVGRVETLVAVGRANIELKQMSLPPAPPDELPELVRFQALRQFTSIGEDWPLDFVPLGSGEADSISVLAASISPDLVQQIRRTCEAAELNPKRLVLRPFAAASLLRRHDKGDRQPCRLMVDLLREEADLTVLDGENLLLTRTVRLHSPEHEESQARGLLGEIRRTIAAANNQLGGRRVEKVILCGDGAEHALIRSLIEKELTLPAEMFDPFAELRRGAELAARPPEHAGRFAPLLGMLCDEAAGTPHVIDFLHPRRKREGTNVRRRNVLIAATLATMCFAALFLIWMQLNSLDDDIALLRGKSALLKSKVKDAEKVRKDAAAVQEFLDHNLNWLDELHELSTRLPPAEDVIVTQLSFAATPPQGGQVRVEGYMREPTQFQEIEDRLRSADRVVSSGTKPNDPKREKYRYGFTELIRIPPASSSTSGPAAPAKSSPCPAKAESSKSSPKDAEKGKQPQ